MGRRRRADQIVVLTGAPDFRLKSCRSAALAQGKRPRKKAAVPETNTQVLLKKGKNKKDKNKKGSFIGLRNGSIAGREDRIDQEEEEKISCLGLALQPTKY